VEDFADQYRHCRGYYRLDWRSDLLRTWRHHRYRECSENLQFTVNNGLQNTSATISGTATLTCQ
jgi:hypothetical protein